MQRKSEQRKATAKFRRANESIAMQSMKSYLKQSKPNQSNATRIQAMHIKEKRSKSKSLRTHRFFFKEVMIQNVIPGLSNQGTA